MKFLKLPHIENMPDEKRSVMWINSALPLRRIHEHLVPYVQGLGRIDSELVGAKKGK